MRIAKYIIRLPFSIIGTVCFCSVALIMWLFDADEAISVKEIVVAMWKL